MIVTHEQFTAAYAKLPEPIREFLAGDDLNKMTSEIGKASGLHVDTVGGLYRETSNMLLGFINPAQFVEELKSLGVPASSIGPIVTELNAKIFTPLHKQVVGGVSDSKITDTPQQTSVLPTPTPTALHTPKPVPPPFVPPRVPPLVPPRPQPVRTPIAPAAPTPSYKPAPPPVLRIPAPEIPIEIPAHVPSPISQFSPKPVSPVRPTPPAMPRPVTVPPVTQHAEASVPPATSVIHRPNPTIGFVPPAPINIPAGEVHTVTRTMAHDMAVLKGTEQPDEPYAPQTSNNVAPVTIPIYVPEPIKHAGPQPAPVKIPTPRPAPSANTANRDALHEVLKQYGVDPYREPTD